MDELCIYKGTVLEKGYGSIGKMVMQDRRLHVIAKAIYCYLATYGERSFPSRERIIKDLGINKDTYTKYLRQLKEFGYISVEQKESEKNKFGHNVFCLEMTKPCTISSDTAPCPISSDTISSDTTKPDTNITSSFNSTSNLNNTNGNTPPIVPHGDVFDKEDQFTLFWKAYPNKKAKPNALKAWKKIKLTPELMKKIMAGLDKAKSSLSWKKDNGQFIPHPATWLNAKRWEDEYEGGGSDGRTGEDGQRHGQTKIKTQSQKYSEYNTQEGKMPWDV